MSPGKPEKWVGDTSFESHEMRTQAKPCKIKGRLPSSFVHDNCPSVCGVWRREENTSCYGSVERISFQLRFWEHCPRQFSVSCAHVDYSSVLR